MKQRHPPGEYVYRDEVLPVLIIGIAFNLAASFLFGAAKQTLPWGVGWYFGLGHLFQDTSGTCFAALALGPWWGALVGVISSTLNTFWISDQFGDAFAYTCVQIGLGLAWGYCGRVIYADRTLLAPRTLELGWRALAGCIVLILAASLTATVLADNVKLALIEAAGGDIFQGPNAPYYTAIRGYLHLAAGQPATGLGWLVDSLCARLGETVLALGIFDFYANLLDKGLSVVTAVGLLRVIGLIPSAHSLGAGTLPWPFLQRLRVGADSIRAFFAVYATYLVISVLVLQRVHFMYSPVDAGLRNWMQPLAGLLGFPFVIGAAAYLLLVLRRKRDSLVEGRRQERRALYGRIRGPNPWSSAGLEKSRLFFVQHNSGYGLIASLAMWPIKSQVMNARGIWIYFFAMAGVSLLFIFERRESLHLFRRAQRWRAELAAGFATPETDARARMLMALLGDIFGGDLAPSGAGRRPIGSGQQVAVNSAASGWLKEMRSINGVDRLLIVAAEAVENADHLARLLTRMRDEADIGVAILLCASVADAEIVQLREIGRATGCSLIVLKPGDIEELIDARSRIDDPGAVLARARVSSRFARLLEMDKPRPAPTRAEATDAAPSAEALQPQ